jgi:competence protein ComEC
VRAHDLRLLVPALAAWGAAWSTVGAPDAGVAAWIAPVVAWAIGAGALASLAVLVVRRPRDTGAVSRPGSPARSDEPRPGAIRGRRRAVAILAVVLVAAACAGLAATQAALQLGARAASPLVEVAAERRTAELTIELTGAPQPVRAAPWSDGGSAVRVDARAIALDGRTIPPVTLVVSLQAGAADLAFGSRAVVAARLAPMASAESAAFRVTASELVGVAPPGAWLAWAASLRAGLSAVASDLGGDGGALVPGLAIGDTSAVGEELDTAMKASSLSHLTAVSGANCAIVTAAGFALAALLGAPRSVRVAIALTALAGFVVLVTPESSVVRAAVMAVVVLIAVASGRSGGGVPALAVAVVVLLAIDPWYARDYGFALSVAATGGLLLLSGPLAGALARVMPRPLAVVVAVPLAAQLACQPVLLLLDPAIPVYGVPANLLAAPAAPVATVAGLVGCLLLPLLPSVGFAFLQLAWLPASWIAVVARGAAGMPFPRVPWLPDAVGAAVFAGVTALGLWLLLAHRAPPALRSAAVAVLLIAVAVPLGLVAGPAVVGRATRPNDWDAAACDVGQGDAVLVREDGATMLIDTGPDPAALARCLDVLDVDRLDLAVLTHWDADHVGGSAVLAGRVDVVLHGPPDGIRSERVLEPLVASGARTLEVQAGASGSLGFARWGVLWPKPGLPPGNDASVVIDLVTSEYRGVFLGDLGEGAQARMLRSADVGRVDLVKVAHHGSADQSESLYRELQATVGVIGVGADNGYGHPTDRLLDLLTATGTTPVRTDRSGLILLDAVGDGAFTVWSERDASEVGGRP